MENEQLDAQQNAPETGSDREINRLLDVPLTVHVELGRRKIKISDLLEVNTGSVVELDTPAGASLAIYANRTLIAQGEAVVVGERYGIRVTEIVSPEERVQQLGGRGD